VRTSLSSLPNSKAGHRDTSTVLTRCCVPRRGAVNLAGAQRDRGVQGLGGLGVGGLGQAAAVSAVGCAGGAEAFHGAFAVPGADLSFGDRELAEENQRLRRRLAHALGQL
jgi:hypothetical protein